jgi:hypothetical protein
MTIETRRVVERRTLQFAGFDDLRADLRRIADAERRGGLRRTGNWSAAQVFNHVAAWMEYPFTGYPMTPPSWPIRIMARAMLGRVLNRPLAAGFRLPRAPDGTYGADDGPLEAAEARLLRAADRLERQCPVVPNPVFGRMTHAQWQRLNLAHAELHFSFLHPS